MREGSPLQFRHEFMKSQVREKIALAGIGIALEALTLRGIEEAKADHTEGEIEECKLPFINLLSDEA